MARRHRPRATAQERRVAAVNTLDWTWFRAHPTEATYRRAYRLGEWPGSDYADDGRRFKVVVVSRIVRAIHRWYLTESPAAFSVGFTSAPDAESLAAVRGLMARFAAQEHIRISEVGEVRR